MSPPARLCLALQATAHELLAIVAFHLLVAGLLVAGLHLFLLRLLLVAGAGILAFQTGAHELLAIVAFLVGGLVVASLHALLLGLLFIGRLLLGFLGRRSGLGGRGLLLVGLGLVLRQCQR